MASVQHLGDAIERLGIPRVPEPWVAAFWDASFCDVGGEFCILYFILFFVRPQLLLQANRHGH